jgi:hypothetical protein
MAEEKLKIKFPKPPVHVTASGALYINADDIVHSAVGQEVILRMATIEPLPHKKSEKKPAIGAEVAQTD